jgi:hypothetical protein
LNLLCAPENRYCERFRPNNKVSKNIPHKTALTSDTDHKLRASLRFTTLLAELIELTESYYAHCSWFMVISQGKTVMDGVWGIQVQNSTVICQQSWGM